MGQHRRRRAEMTMEIGKKICVKIKHDNKIYTVSLQISKMKRTRWSKSKDGGRKKLGKNQKKNEF